MSVLALTFEQEARTIDAYRPGIDSTAPKVTQLDLPGQNPNGFGESDSYVLPDPAVGGQNASGVQQGFSTGFAGMRARLSPFRGAVAKPPAVSNPVQGDVGRNNRQAALYAGVMAQGVTYNPASLSYSANWVGPNGV